MAQSFKYIGTGLTAAEFVPYVAAYDFGSVLPDQFVFHNSANPDASWAPLDSNPKNNWDRDEAGLTEPQIKAKRKAQLDAIMRYYRDTNGWTAGPHLFVDDRWIWLFTPMYDIGVHAMEGNSYHDAAGRLHYTIGIETIGYFDRVGWPPAMQYLLRVVVHALCSRLPITIAYTPAPRHHPELHEGSIAFHRDYNKAECPGAVITPDYAIAVLTEPPAAPQPYLVRGLPIYDDSQGHTPSGRYLLPGSKVRIDRVAAQQPADYREDFGHVADVDGGGFIDLNGAVKV